MKKVKKRKWRISKILLIVVLVAFSVIGILLYRYHLGSICQNCDLTVSPSPTPLGVKYKYQPFPEPSLEPVSISGTLTQLSDLHLLKNWMNLKTTFQYYSAGLITSGKYKGYTRILVATPGMGEGQPACRVLTYITKDNKNYYLLTGNNTMFYHPENAKTLNTYISDFPNTIKLNNVWELEGTDYATITNPQPLALEELDAGDYSCSLLINFSRFTKLPFTYNGITFYQMSGATNTSNVSYDRSPVEVIGVDQVGIVYEYYETFKSKFLQYPFPTYGNLNSAIVISTADIISKAPVYPWYGTDDSFFTNGILMSDLNNIGKLRNGITVYALKNSNSLIYKSLFNEKFNANNKVVSSDRAPLPKTLKEYTSKYPIIFIKDYWGNIVGIEESEYYYPLDGG